MINFIKALPFILRVYSLPISVFSWFVAFCYGISCNGNIKYGILALFGICLAHLGANAFDDYIDYNNLKKEIDTDTQKKRLINAQRDKCNYIFENNITPKQVLITSFVCLAIAAAIGLFFTLKCGVLVLGFMAITSILLILYPYLGNYRLCETAIFLIYGLLLFGGMGYIMTGTYNPETVIACLPSTLMTLNILYTDTLMDYHYDKNEGKKTLANLFNSQQTALYFQKSLIAMSYISLILITLLNIGSWKIYFTVITIPLATKLIKSLSSNINEKINSDDIFMARMCEVRNLMVCFSVIFGLSLLWK